MEETEIVHEPADQVETQTIAAVLEQAGIPYAFVSYRDTAYPGIVDRGRPFGAFRVEASLASEARRVIREYLDAEVIETEP